MVPVWSSLDRVYEIAGGSGNNRKPCLIASAQTHCNPINASHFVYGFRGDGTDNGGGRGVPEGDALSAGIFVLVHVPLLRNRNMLRSCCVAQECE
jgi:hypothetical protein